MNTPLTPFNAAARIALVAKVVMARVILDGAIVSDIEMTHAPEGEPYVDLETLQSLNRQLTLHLEELARFDARTPLQHAWYEARDAEFARQRALVKA